MFSVIFDMDGTLLDTQRICIPAWEYAGRLQGVVGLGEHVPRVCGMNGEGSNRYLRENFPKIDVDIFKADMREYINRNGVVRYKKGAKELLDYLRNKCIKIALASGTSTPSVMHHLKEVDATKYFSAIVCGNDVKNGKPAPDVFLKAAEKIGATPEECFVVEDSANGVVAAYRAGMKCIGIPDIVDFEKEIEQLMFAKCESMTEALDIFKKML